MSPYNREIFLVIPTTLSVLSDNLIFLGSRLGNSLLLEYTVSEESTSNGEAGSLDGNKPAPHSVSQPPEAKRKRINTAAEWEGVVKPNQAVLDAEEEELTSIEGYYGNEILDVDFVEHYELKTMDSMNNIGPCANAELIHSSNINEQYDDIRNDARDRNLDLMVLTGKGKSGAITLLQKSIRPNIVTSFPFPTNYNDMWTLNDNKSEFNSLLVITKKDQTMIFKTGAQIEELKREDCGLSTTAKTIFCCTMSNGLYIIQVLPRAVILVQQQTQEKLQHMPMDLDGMIIQASSSDPFVAILTSKGVMVNLKLSLDQEGKPLLQAVKTPEQFPEIPEKKITHVTMITDKGAKFKLKMGRKQLRDEENSRNLERNPFPSESNFRSTAIESSNNILTAEEEDELLYGVETQDSVFDGPDMTNATNDNELYKDTEADSRSWMAITRQSGNIEFYTLPDCELRFKDRNFANAPRLVESSRFEGGESRRGDVPIIQEINLFHLGPREIPHLVAIISDQLLIYQYRPCKIKYETKKPMLGGRFIKQRPTELLRTLPGTQEEGKKSKNNKMIRHFDDINGYSGFVLTGPYPYWCIAGKSGRLRLHSQWQDGMINCFTQFHNENCNNGFLYFQHQTKTLSVSTLQMFWNYDGDWATRKIKLGYTPHFASYDIEQKVVTVACSREEKIEMLPKITAEGNKEYEAMPDIPNIESQLYPQYFVEMYSPTTWEIVPNSRIEMDPHEHILTLKTVFLKSEASLSGRKQYIAIGTSNICGEDYQSRGRLILLEVIDVVPEPGKPLTRHRFKTVYDKPQRGTGRLNAVEVRSRWLNANRTRLTLTLRKLEYRRG